MRFAEGVGRFAADSPSDFGLRPTEEQMAGDADLLPAGRAMQKLYVAAFLGEHRNETDFGVGVRRSDIAKRLQLQPRGQPLRFERTCHRHALSPQIHAI
jgi:hypothetical protein